MRRPYLRGFFAILVTALAPCGGTGFEKESVIKGVRVLAVRKEPAYPHPGETVSLTMLYWDGKRSQSGRSPVQVLWIGGDARWSCINPKGDLYYGCFGSAGTTETADAAVPDAGDAGAVADAGAIAEAGGAADAAAPDAAAPNAGAAPALADHVSTHNAFVPDGILKPIPPEQGSPYGLEYVFFAVCAGRIDFVAPANSPNTLPVGCYGPAGELLGPDDFVPGYTSLYVYADRRNANPIVSSLLLDGVPIGSPTGPTATQLRVPRCTASDSIDCPAHTIKVAIDPASAEPDPSSTIDNRPLQEQLWVAFYTTAGEFKSELRLVNDGQKGWNEDNGTEWRAPMTAGPVRLWGVVHDSRGGVAWTEGEVIVE